MNWFERYGIVGMFFIFMTGAWLFFLFPGLTTILFRQIKTNTGLANLIIGIFTLGFLPLGYLIVILSQVLYYRKDWWEHIHCKCWDALNKEIQEKIQSETKLLQNDIKKEDKMEAVLTYYDRMKTKDVEKNKFLSMFATKRYDVIAINRSLFLALILSLCFAIFITLAILNFTWKELWNFIGIKYLSLILFLVINFYLFKILSHSSSILEHQIIEIEKIKLQEINGLEKKSK